MEYTLLKGFSLLSPFIRAAIFLGAGWLAGLFAQKIVHNWVTSHDTDPSVVLLLGSAVRYTCFIVSCVSAFSTLGGEIQSIITGFGFTGFVVSFVLKDTIANIIGGVFILIYRPFKIGQEIKINYNKSGMGEGIVTKIDLRYTHLQNGNETVLVPNSVLFTNSIAIVQATEKSSFLEIEKN